MKKYNKKFELAQNLIRAKNRLFHNARKLIRVKIKFPRARKLVPLICKNLTKYLVL